MLGKILPVLLVIAGTGGGVGAGLILRPDPKDVSQSPSCEDLEPADVAKTPPISTLDEAQDVQEREYVKMNNQFVVPVVGDQLVDALVVMALTLEVAPGKTNDVYTREPKLRDAFLQVLFDHANLGGFKGEFTNAKNMDVLRAALTETAQTLVGTVITGVLITDIARQDI